MPRDYRLWTDKEVSAVERYAREGYTFEGIAESVGRSYDAVYRIARLRGIRVRRKTNPSVEGGQLRRKEIDRLLDGRYSMLKIGRKTKPAVARKNRAKPYLSKQRIHQYLIATDQLYGFRLRRKKFLARQV